MNVKLLSMTQNPLETMAYAASRCYMSEPRVEIVKHCWESGHCSIAEHAYFTFEITGVSRSLLAQLTRHRLASYFLISQRYVDMKDYDMIIPHKIDNNPAAKEIFNKAIDATRDCYKELQELDIKNEDARAVLPNACSTNLVMTIKLRSLSNFMNERLCKKSQDEIRKLAKLMKEAVLSENCWGDFKEYLDKRILVPKCEKNKVKFCPERKSCGRHETATKINSFLNNYPTKNLETEWHLDGDIFYCSCGAKYDIHFSDSNYCPNCGNKIKKGE